MEYIVYILQSEKDGSYYTGFTTDLKLRIKSHNDGTSTYSSSKKPFILVWHCSFSDKKLAADFERYLKSGSGIAFRNKRLINYHK
ncbi:MAG: GIY-YIG nuclease family protein [Candidatus Parcubacteria bacterium]|nr:GIY-YIG nuclease family protein [Candidatus Parcubacteria bacterium]